MTILWSSSKDTNFTDNLPVPDHQEDIQTLSMDNCRHQSAQQCGGYNQTVWKKLVCTHSKNITNHNIFCAKTRKLKFTPLCNNIWVEYDEYVVRRTSLSRQHIASFSHGSFTGKCVRLLCASQASVALDNNDNNNNERISRAPFHVKHAQLRWTGANTKIWNTCI